MIRMDGAAGELGLAAVILLTSSCGYSMLRRDRILGHSTVVVEPFTEDVPLGLSADLARSLRNQLASGGITVTDDRDRAGAVLRGTIVATRTTPSPTTAGLRARISSYQLQVEVRAALADTSGAALWSTSLMMTEDFFPDSTAAPGTLVSEASRRRALHRLAGALAQEIYTRLLLAQKN